MNQHEQRMADSGHQRGFMGAKPNRATHLAVKYAHELGSVLDYGCGAKMVQLTHLRELRPGIRQMVGYDPHHHPEIKLVPGSKFSTVLLSNVLNVQRSEREARNILHDAASHVALFGTLIVTFPKAPNYGDIDPHHMMWLWMENSGFEIIRCGGIWDAPSWVLRRTT